MAHKKTFEFRMSKKVAELTQVVHMLFMRNHEKEVEIDALKEAYEDEIEIVIKDAKSRIERLEYQVRDMSRKVAREDEKLAQELKEDFSKKEQDWAAKFARKDEELMEEKRDCQNVRDLLINMQKDMETLKQGKESALSRKITEVEMKNKEIARLKGVVSDLERKVKETDQHSHGLLGELQRSYEKLRKEHLQIRDTLQDTEKMKEQLVLRNKHLDGEIKMLKKELAKRSSTDKPRSTHVESRLFSSSSEGYDDELDRLRKQVQRYRLELSNRESNFNRMFTEKKPVFVDGRLARVGIKQGDIRSISHLPYGRQKTPVPDSRGSSDNCSPPEDILHRSAEYRDVRDIASARSRASSVGSVSVDRLPQLGMDTRGRSGHLVKPRPLPKELLSSKPMGKA